MPDDLFKSYQILVNQFWAHLSTQVLDFPVCKNTLGLPAFDFPLDGFDDKTAIFIKKIVSKPQNCVSEHKPHLLAFSNISK
jgi:hypothetical protein